MLFFVLNSAGDDHKLTTAYLLCLCIQHSASSFPPGSFGKLLLKIVRRIQTIAWVSAWPTSLLLNQSGQPENRNVPDTMENSIFLSPQMKGIY